MKHEANSGVDNGRGVQAASGEGGVNAPAASSRAFEWLTIAIGVGLWLFILFKVSGNQFIGFSEDSAGYAEIARNMLQGKGFVQDFIDFYFTKYPAIPHKTSHWLSLYVILSVPFFALMSNAAFAAKIVSTLFYLFCGVQVLWCGKKLFGSTVGCATALLFFLHPTAIYLATQGLPDLLLTFFILAVITLLHRDTAGWWWVSGICFYLGMFTKQTMVLLIPVLLVVSLWNRRRLRYSWKPLIITVTMGVLLYVLTIAVCHYAFGIPLNDDHITLLCRLGYGDNIIEDHYAVIWDEAQSNCFQRMIERGPKAFLRRWWTMIVKYCSVHYYAEGGVGFGQFILFPYSLLAFVGLWFTSRKGSAVLAVSMIVVWFTFFTALFTPVDRYFLPLLIMLLMLSTEGLCKTIDNVMAQNQRFTTKAAALTVVLLLVAWYCTRPTLLNFYAHQPYDPFNEMNFRNRPDIIRIFREMRAKTEEDAVIMTLLPATTHFYAKRYTIPIPYEDYQRVNNVLAYYDADYFLDLFPRRIYKGNFSLPIFDFQHQWHTSDGSPIILYRIDHRPPAELAPNRRWALHRGFLFYQPEL